MGILKHVVLPLYSVALLLSGGLLIGTGWVKEDTSSLNESWGGDERDFSEQPLTALEMHLMHVMGGVFLMLGINAVVAIAYENSHYRAMAVMMVMFVCSIDLHSYVRLGRPIAPPLYGMLGLGAVGLAVNSMEPGVFTKDKNAKSKTG